MKTINQIDINYKSVLIRVDYNVPIRDNQIIDTFRIDASLKTIKYCLKQGCKVILMSHLGRPQKKDLKYSLEPIFKYLKTVFSNKIYFSPDCISEEAIELSKNLKSGEIHLLENLRFYNEEVVCDKQFGMQLSKHADVFINDAFGTAHRKHASNVSVANFFTMKGCGFLISKEVEYLQNSIENKNQKLVVLLGGAKISDKIKLISRFKNIADKILIGGAMSNNFLAAKRMSIGKSMIEKDYIPLAKEIMLENNSKILIPSDVICSQSIEDVNNIRVVSGNDIGSNDITVDIGPETIAKFSRAMKDVDCILWNGPMGIIEKKEFSNGTNKMIDLIKKMTKKGTVSIIGGGDTSSIIKKDDFNVFTHISTGGGASLKLLGGSSMPAFNALK